MVGLQTDLDNLQNDMKHPQIDFTEGTYTAYQNFTAPTISNATITNGEITNTSNSSNDINVSSQAFLIVRTTSEAVKYSWIDLCINENIPTPGYVYHVSPNLFILKFFLCHNLPF